MKNNIVFMGSPYFAATVLKAVSEVYQINGIVTQPDKPAGRGKILTPPPVKELARDLQIPMIQPRKLKDEGVFEQLSAWKPDLIIVAAFGQILRSNILNLPPLGCINVHASYLPRWRGAAPIQAAILAGDETTGVSIMRMDEGIDTGDILNQKVVKIIPSDTTESLSVRLANEGAKLLLQTLPDYIIGNTVPQKQDDTQATYAGMIRKEDGVIDLALSALEIERKVRAYNPWPIARLHHRDQEIQVYRARVEESVYALPGREDIIRKYPAIGTGRGWLILEEVQLPGKKRISGKDYLNGQKNWGNFN